jgi:hypothetical protein
MEAMTQPAKQLQRIKASERQSEGEKRRIGFFTGNLLDGIESEVKIVCIKEHPELYTGSVCGRCGKTAEKCDYIESSSEGVEQAVEDLLRSLDRMANIYDGKEFGLPVGDPHTMDHMMRVVKDKLSQLKSLEPTGEVINNLWLANSTDYDRGDDRFVKRFMDSDQFIAAISSLFNKKQ